MGEVEIMAAIGERKAVVHFPEDFNEQSGFEMPSRGYLSHSIVQTADGARYPVFFVDPVRLQQELEMDARSGRAFFAEVNLIVLPEVTIESIQSAVEALANQGYFQQLKPLT
jgi:hypothetical protein